MSRTNERKLLDLKQDIDKAKTNVSQLEGQKAQLLQTLKNDWKCNTVEEAEVKLKEMEKECEDLNTQIDEGVAKLQQDYEL
jgi:predicted  nucleic acid-binding Zn-ribbon protein